jgi:hypothetical protein
MPFQKALQQSPATVAENWAHGIATMGLLPAIEPVAIPHRICALRLILCLQKNNNFTTDLTNMGTPKNEETNPIFF